jgi:hypothetical protein
MPGEGVTDPAWGGTMPGTSQRGLPRGDTLTRSTRVSRNLPTDENEGGYFHKGISIARLEGIMDWRYGEFEVLK